MGHFWRGMSRGDVKELGEALDAGEAALIVVGRSRVLEQAEKLVTRAERTLEKELKSDEDEFQRELREAEKESAAA
jgi:precorrin-6B methylase 1